MALSRRFVDLLKNAIASHHTAQIVHASSARCKARRELSDTAAANDSNAVLVASAIACAKNPATNIVFP